MAQVMMFALLFGVGLNAVRPQPYPAADLAPEFPSGIQWLNTGRPLTLRELRGKVVLLDFWTYGCINCLHIIPDVQRLEAAYPRNLVVIGVHSAKYDNEKMVGNIRQAMRRYGIAHAVVNDRDFHIWNAYRVPGWPTQVVIDPEGRYLMAFVGENHYDRIDQLVKGTIDLHRTRGTLREGALFLGGMPEEHETSPLLYPGLATFIGVPLGIVSGFYGGNIDALVMRTMDLILAFPVFLLAIILMVMFTPAAGIIGTMKVVSAIAIVRIPIFARLVRGSVLSIKEKEYIEACRAVGQHDAKVLLWHVLPNCMTPIIVTATLGIATAIIVEASLSFLGLGTQPPTPSWGWDLKANVAWIQENPWLALGPGFAIFVTVLGFNLFGDGLRDALDPRLK